MELLKWELRKIWQGGILAAIALLGALYYFLFPSFYIKYFCNGPASQAQFDLSAAWVERFGPTIEQSELPQIRAQLAEEIALFGTRAAAIPAAVEAGLTGYDAFLSFQNAYYEAVRVGNGQADMDTERLNYLIMENTNYYTITALEEFLQSYDGRAEPSRQDLLDIGYTDVMIRRLSALAQPDLRSGYLPSGMMDSTNEYAKGLAVWAVLSTVLLLSPTLVRDQLRRTRAMQWTSRRGRRILTAQMGAAGLSALALWAVSMTLYALPFLSKGPLVFRDCRLYSLWDGSAPWFNWTYGTYLLALMGLIFAISLTTAALTVFLSQYSANYVSMLLKSLPLFVVLGPLSAAWMLDRAFFFRPLWPKAQGCAWVFAGGEAVLAALLLSLGLGLCLLSCVRQRQRPL
ncbi:hypothetical protein KQI82_00920 [Oscillibacter sp. MSJ-2]|uniref:ABC transporter permease n=1 Tax=Dysosmobacter acutus TaxID=2841504 RepID=A0ABS6F743_9FIRM|nr:hypothetical protein [Dysosmobacter acutus]MBU5625496.1 hypothetical protein [Dysosmobacter acutus]